MTFWLAVISTPTRINQTQQQQQQQLWQQQQQHYQQQQQQQQWVWLTFATLCAVAFVVYVCLWKMGYEIFPPFIFGHFYLTMGNKFVSQSEIFCFSVFSSVRRLIPTLIELHSSVIAKDVPHFTPPRSLIPFSIYLIMTLGWGLSYELCQSKRLIDIISNSKDKQVLQIKKVVSMNMKKEQRLSK